MKECRLDQNLKPCNCSYEPCSRKGRCCECLKYHWDMQEMPACFFPDTVERTYDLRMLGLVDDRDRPNRAGQALLSVLSGKGTVKSKEKDKECV